MQIVKAMFSVETQHVRYNNARNQIRKYEQQGMKELVTYTLRNRSRSITNEVGLDVGSQTQ